MDGLKCVVVCVDFDDFLAITLPWNAKHFSDCVVVTSHEDERTEAVVNSVPGTRLLRTDAFTRNGAIFNKGLAIEEGFDALGRSGWILYIDVDIALPATFEPKELDRNVLYGIDRRLVPDGIKVDLNDNWEQWELLSSGADVFGYFQLFHAEAEALRTRPWYGTDYTTCGFCDCEFNDKFPYWCVLPDAVLHIGQSGANWFGRGTPRLDGELLPDGGENLLRMGELFFDLGWEWARPDLQSLVVELGRRQHRPPPPPPRSRFPLKQWRQ